MKKFLVVMAALLLMASATFAGYEDYYKARKAAKVAESQGDTKQAVAMFLSAEAEASVLAAEDGMKLPWALYAEWQRNNAANTLIDRFKLKTGWVEVMDALKSIPNGKERLAAAEALKTNAAPFVGLLKSALEILNGKKFVKAEVLAKVKSNKEFCAWVIDFCK